MFGAPSFGKATLGVGKIYSETIEARDQRRQPHRIVKQHKAYATDHSARFVAQRQTHDDEGLFAKVHDVEHDRSARFDHFSHQAIGHDALHRLSNCQGRIGKAETLRIAVVHPDDASMSVDDNRTVANISEMAEQRLGRDLDQMFAFAGNQRFGTSDSW